MGKQLLVACLVLRICSGMTLLLLSCGTFLVDPSPTFHSQQLTHTHHFRPCVVARGAQNHGLTNRRMLSQSYQNDTQRAQAVFSHYYAWGLVVLMHQNDKINVQLANFKQQNRIRRKQINQLNNINTKWPAKSNTSQQSAK